ncbi:hypothetical protein [Demequina sp. NBRC 110057]|uniref:hypothetical protein n=1 Tax=Demequina sp. NBRC 110057 TaxID=1570346 RepID=UPI000A054CFF|nr:hypothetical protein [Demequina sp. NBRC 110057]
MTDLPHVAGDVPTIERAAGNYSDVAAAVRDAARAMRSLSHGTHGSQSDAVTALASQAGTVADRLDRLEDRYRAAGSALTTYARELDSLQVSADESISRAATAAEDRDRATRLADYYRAEYDGATDPAAATEALSNQRYWEGQRDEAAAAVSHAAAAVDDAHRAQAAAARRAADAIDTAVDADGLNDSWWDNVKGWVSDNAGLLRALKDALSMVTTVLTFVSMVIPVVAPFALASAALTVGLSGLLAASGEISWLEFGLDALLLVTAGVGAVAGKVVSTSVSGLKSARVARLAAQGGAKSPLRQVTGSFNRLSIPTRTMSQKFTAAIPLKGIAAKYRGIGNAHAWRIFTMSKVGASAADDAFIKPGMAWIRAARATAVTQTVFRVSDTIGGHARTVEQALTPTPLDPVTAVARGIADGHEYLHRATTATLGGQR